MLPVTVAAFCLLSSAGPLQGVPPRAAPVASQRSGVRTLDSAATVRGARAALARVFRPIGVSVARYRVIAFTRDSLGTIVGFTSCRAAGCVDGGASVRVRADGRARVLTVR